MRLPLSYTFKSLVRRPRRSIWIMLGVAVAVFLSIAMTSMTHGLIESTIQTGSEDNVLVLSRGADSMEFSAVDPDEFHILQSVDGLQTRDGRPMASPEILLNTFVGLADGTEDRAVVRGVRPVAWDVHESVQLVEGRLPEASDEVVVGRLAATRLGVNPDELAIGNEIEFEGATWTIAGTFRAPGTTLESEIWADLDGLATVSRRDDYSAVVLRAEDSQGAEDIVFDLATRTDIRVEPRLERDYYAARAEALEPLRTIGFLMTFMLVFGAALAAVNTMYASLANRRRQMATLVVLGYKQRAVMAAFGLESLAVALAGGVLGAGASLLVDGLAMNIPMGVFRFTVEPWMLAGGLGLALVVGLIGASLPLWRLSRLSPGRAMRD